MQTKTIRIISVLLVAATILCGHTLFLKPSSYFVEPDRDVTVALLNGTFQKSENVITRDRMRDVSIVNGNGTVQHPDTSQWYDEGTRSKIDFTTGETGTYVLGVSTASRTISLSTNAFIDYLRHEGVADVLTAQKEAGPKADSVQERYSKHVKTLVQVGEKHTDAYQHRLGYPIEIVPQENPFSLQTGENLDVQVLHNGEPVSDQVVYANYQGHHSHGEDGGHEAAVQVRTDDEGIANIPLNHEGKWYVRLIHMVEVPGSEVDYESNWATLTFEVR